MSSFGPPLRIECSFSQYWRYEKAIKDLSRRGRDDIATLITENGVETAIFEPMVTFYGSNDFHHLSLPLIRRIHQPFNLVRFISSYCAIIVLLFVRKVDFVWNFNNFQIFHFQVCLFWFLLLFANYSLTLSINDRSYSTITPIGTSFSRAFTAAAGFRTPWTSPRSSRPSILVRKFASSYYSFIYASFDIIHINYSLFSASIIYLGYYYENNRKTKSILLYSTFSFYFDWISPPWGVYLSNSYS